MCRNNIRVSMGMLTGIRVCCAVLFVVKKVVVFHSVPIFKEHPFYQFRHGSLIMSRAYFGKLGFFVVMFFAFQNWQMLQDKTGNILYFRQQM